MFSLLNKFISLATEAEKPPPVSKDINTILKNLSSIETFSVRISYAEKCLDRVSSGSSRIVFSLPNNKVIKLASNEKGVAQNSAETKVKYDSVYINQVEKHCPNYYWIIAPKAKKITPKIFEKLSGMPIELVADLIKSKIDKSSIKKFEEFKDNEMLNDLVEITKKYKLMIGDLKRISSYGVINNKPVLIDLGLNKNTYNKYYSSSNKKKSSSNKS